ncbi:MAG: TonB-dependent receptor [Woeseiaceae bacterium]|nr:TonB-dependent receptor [Woeseiaceae bacterium]
MKKRNAIRVLVLATVVPSIYAAAESPSTGAAAQLEEIVVTAQKQRENLQHMPAAVTAVSGDALVAAGVTDIRAAQNLVPSVRFQAENASTEIYIRGVGSTLDLPNIEPPTVFNINGVYIPREATSVGLFDLERLEVLPGPQGTLYGRGSLGGTVNGLFNRPGDTLQTRAVLEAGNYSLVHGTIVQNLPVTDEFALRGAFDYIHHDGYQKTGADSKGDYSARLSALYEPVDELSIYFWSHGAKKKGRSPNLVRRGYNDGNFDGDPTSFDSGDPWNDVITPDAPDAGQQHYEHLNIGVEVDWNLGGTTLTYIPSYVYLDWEGNYWLEDIPAFLSSYYNQTTHELRLANERSDRVQWLGGLYAYRTTGEGQFTAGGFPLADVLHNRLAGVAAFGEATFPASDSLRFTVGGRYSNDDRQGQGVTAFGEPYDADQSFDRLDWKVGTQYDLNPTSMLYATIQTGYQPGTYNLFPSTSAQSNEVGSADLTAYTLGVKSRLLDGRLQINNEVFYYDYRDMLVQSFNLNTSLLTTFSADKVTIYGDQLDALLQLTDSDRINLSIGYLHADYVDFIVPPGIDIGEPRRDFGGYQLQYAPDWTVSAGYLHDFRYSSGYLRARADTRYESSFWGTFNHARGTEQPDYFKSDASLTYVDNDQWTLGVWIRNIEDVPVLAATTTGQFGPYGDAFIEPPRTYGLRLTLEF